MSRSSWLKAMWSLGPSAAGGFTMPDGEMLGNGGSPEPPATDPNISPKPATPPTRRQGRKDNDPLRYGFVPLSAATVSPVGVRFWSPEGSFRFLTPGPA